MCRWKSWEVRRVGKSKWIGAFAAGAMAACLAFGTASAAKISAYSNMLAGRSCTIRYENITPAVRIHNWDSVHLGFAPMEIPPLYASQGYKGILVLRGDESYVEINYEDAGYAKCALRKKDEVYQFSRQTKGKNRDKIEYQSKEGKNKVSAEDFDIESALVYGESFGPADVSRLLAVMLPASKKPAGMPDYQYVGSGSLPGGLSYEDYRTAGDDSGLEAVRYYFQGNALVKIAAASYYRKPDGNFDGRKCVLKIEEFSNLPDGKALVLPENLEDKTKRDKAGKNDED